MPLLLKSWRHWEMDGDQQLNFYYCCPVALMNTFICQPKFAGKTYVKFEGQESTAIIWQISRLASKLHISRSASHRHAQSPMAAFILCWQFVLMHAFNFISHALWELQLSAICCINNKNSISYIFCILYILCIFIWILTLSTVQLERAAWISIKTSKWKQRTGIYKTYEKNICKYTKTCKQYANNMQMYAKCMQNVCKKYPKISKKYPKNKTKDNHKI